MPRKRFPFFTLPPIPVPKFLKADLKKADDFIVLLRITPNITLSRYLDEMGNLLLFTITMFTLIVTLLLFTLSTNFSTLLHFFSHVLHLLVLSLFSHMPIPASQALSVPCSIFLLVFLSRLSGCSLRAGGPFVNFAAYGYSIG